MEELKLQRMTIELCHELVSIGISTCSVLWAKLIKIMQQRENVSSAYMDMFSIFMEFASNVNTHLAPDPFS